MPEFPIKTEIGMITSRRIRLKFPFDFFFNRNKKVGQVRNLKYDKLVNV